MSDVDKELEQFFEAIKPLSDKTLALLIQLLPYKFSGVEDPISSRNRFHIFEINRGPEHSRKGFWPDTN